MKVSRKLYLKESMLLYAVLLYIYLSIFIFVLTWMKLSIGIWIVLFVTWAIVRFCQCVHADKKQTGEEQIEINALFCICIAGMVFLLGYYFGWSGSAPQASDWHKHNAVLRDLIVYDWPVYYQERETAMLSYYIGQYLVPALAGKIFSSFFVGQQILYIWNCIGLLLVTGWLFMITNADNLKKQVCSFLTLIFFGGLLPMAQRMMALFRNAPLKTFANNYSLVVDGISLQYRSNFVDLRWVFAQCLIPWLLILLFLRYRKYLKYYAVIFLPGILYATMPFLGIAGLVGADIAVRFLFEQDKKSFLKQLFSLYNIGMILSLGGILITYLAGNVFSDKPEALGISIIDYSGSKILIYLVFCLCMFGIYTVLIFRSNRYNSIMYITVILLFVIPFFSMGHNNDFCMSVSIPLLFMLMIMLLWNLFLPLGEGGSVNQKMWCQVRKGAILLCLCVGATLPMRELYSVIKADIVSEQQAADSFYSLAGYADRVSEDIPISVKYNYYAYDIPDNFFVQYLARKK